MANTGITAGTYGDASHTLQIGVDTKGRINSIIPQAITSALGSAVFSGNGYQQFSNGLIIQWGTVANGQNNYAVTFPIAFPNNCFNVSSSQTTATAVIITNMTRTGFTTSVGSLTWMAIGN